MFGKSFDQIEWRDLQQLLHEKATENIRLEFKLKPPNKDELLKKLSSFANTSGGYVIVGAAGDNDGRLVDLPGVEKQNSYKQTIVQWCSDGIYPLVTPQVSHPIAIPGDGGQVCYIIYVPESDVAPHFLNGRRGVYVRTDEFSHRFESKHATDQELLMMLNRRKAVVDRREQALQRARRRFDALKRKVSEKDLGRSMPLPVYIALTLTPTFPSSYLADARRLDHLARTTKVAWRGTGFPNSKRYITQHESTIGIPCGDPLSMFEFNTIGMITYLSAIADERDARGIHLNHFLGYILVCLRHAGVLLSKVDVSGDISIRVSLIGIQDIPWIYRFQGGPEDGPSSELDNEAELSLRVSSERLYNSQLEIAENILQFAFFATNASQWIQSHSDVLNYLKSGYEYNYWPWKNEP